MESATPDRAGALADFDRALALAPTAAAALTARGLLHKSEGRLAAARQDFDAAVAVDPNRDRPWMLRAHLRRCAGELDGAVADFMQAIAAKGPNDRALFRDILPRQGFDPGSDRETVARAALEAWLRSLDCAAAH